MKIESISQKIVMTVLVAFGGVLWLNVWHQIGHNSHEVIEGASTMTYWLSDSITVLLPVLFVIWGGSFLAQWLEDRFSGRISSKALTALTVILLGGLTSTLLVAVEATRILPTGMRNDFALIVSVCRTVNSASFQIVDALFRNISNLQTERLHVILQDWSTLALANLVIVFLAMLVFNDVESHIAAMPSFQLNKASLVELFKAMFSAQRRIILVLSISLAYGGLSWMQYLHELRGIHEEQNISPVMHWLRDASLAFPAVLIGVIASIALWKKYNQKFLSPVFQKPVLAVVLGLSATIVFMLGVPVHDALFNSGHEDQSVVYPFSADHHYSDDASIDSAFALTRQAEEAEGTLLQHAASDGFAALPVNLSIALFIVFFLDTSVLQNEDTTKRRSRFLQPAAPVQAAWNGRLVVRSLLTAVTFLATPSLALTFAPQPALANSCTRTIYADVVALDQQFYYNRLGAWNPAGMMYALRRDVVDNNTGLTEAEGGTLTAGQVSLRSDKRPRPIVLRANIGDCLEIHFANLLNPIPLGGQPADRNVGIHVNGMQISNSVGDSGSFVGKNPSSLVAPGGSTVYTLQAQYENTYLLYDLGVSTGGEGNGGTLAYGLFGAVNVEPANAGWGSEWYRSQLTRVEMDWATPAETFVDSNANGKWDAALTAESFTDVNGNGIWDAATAAEPFVDANGNGAWDAAVAAESFVDANINGAWDAAVAAETFTDANGNETWDEGEAFEDANANGLWDAAIPAETLDDVNGNGVWDAASDAESFTDENGNGVWDAAAADEPFLDENGNGILDISAAAEALTDTNGNGIWDAHRTTPAGQPILDYDAVYPADAPFGKAGLPIINLLAPKAGYDGELVHSDINAMITGPGRSDFPDGYYLADDVYGSQDRGEPFREFTVIFHDEIFAVQAFPQFYENPNLSHALGIVKDGFAINYGTGGIGSEIIANRLGVGPMANCVECKYEEFFLTSTAVGDPAMIVDIPADQTIDPVTFEPNGLRATKALYPDDPSNVHHSYLNDHIKFRQLHAGPKEHHIFHLHAHQWQYNWNDPNSNYLDSQGIGPGSGFTYEIAYGGAGNRNKTPGDAIFHCHFYPHFAMGMWEMWRIHDTFELGTELSENGVPVQNSRALPDGEILAGTPIPGVVPLPSEAPVLPNQGRPVKAMAPMPDSDASVVAYDENGDGILDSSQYDLDANGIADLVTAFNVQPSSNPGFPFYIPAVAGHRPPTPALDMVYDGGLPRHIITGGQHAGVTHEQFQTRLDFNKELLSVGYLPLPETGTPAEVVAMNFHGQLWHESYLPDGTPVSATNPILAMSGRPMQGFETNGLPPQPGSPFAEPCRTDPTAANGWSVNAIPQNKIYKGVDIQIDLTMNKVGWHFPQQRIITLWDDAQAVIDGDKAPEPLVMRLNAGDCATFWHANLVPNVYELDDYQVRTPTDIIGQHIHLVKFDVVASDGSANGYNYEDGTLSPLEVQERIHAITANGCSGFECPAAQVHPFFGAGPDDNGDGVGDWVGARTTAQRWYADPMLNLAWDNGLGTVFTHDHYGPSTHQQVGLYATVIIEPTGAQYRDPETGVIMGSRHDGGPTSWRADIINIRDSSGKDMSHREFYFEFADFQHAYQAGGGQLTMVDNGEGVMIPSYADFQNVINPSFRVQPPPGLESSLVYYPPTCPDGSPRPCPEAISGDDPGTYVVNYRNEPVGLRIYDPATKSQAVGQAGDLAYAFSSLIARAIPALNQPFNAYPPLTQGVGSGDPATPLLRVYMGDKIRLRVQVGAHEEEHNFMIHGLKWKKEPMTGNSGWKDAEFMGISEYAVMEMPILPDIGVGTPHKTDYFYTMGAQIEDYWNGIWGIMRSYNKLRTDLLPLPNNPVGTTPLVITNEKDFNNICPITAPLVKINVTAVRAADVLPGGTLVYNNRATSLIGPIAFDPATGEPTEYGPVGNGPLNDPSALLYVRTEDLVINRYGKPVGLRPGTPIEPLILRARAGDCIRLTLANALPANLTWTDPNGVVRPDMPNFSALPGIIHKDSIMDAEIGASGMITFNVNDITPSSSVGLHPQLLSYNVREADNFVAGNNSLNMIVVPGAKKTYTWYAGDVDMVPDTSTSNPDDYKLVATPVEYGATGLLPADRIKGSTKGLVGALIVEPQGSTWVEDPGTRASATVTKTDGTKFRDFVTIIQNDANFRFASGCNPSLSNLFCAVKSIQSEGGFTPEDPQDSGHKAINYGADPVWYRLGVTPETPFEALLDRTDTHLAFSNALVGGDPQTEVFVVSPNGPSQVRMRVVAPGGHARGIVYVLNGHSWLREPYVNNSTEIGNNSTAWWTNSQEGIGAGSSFNMLVSTSADPNGDYMFHDFGSFGKYQGIWGLMRKNNTEPLAKDDTYTTAKNTARNVSAASGVLKNDIDLDGDKFTATLTSGARTTAGGSIVLNADGSFKYTPPVNFTGVDTFQYKICPACSPVTASISVGKAPVAYNESYTIVAGTPTLTLPAPGLLVNDKDPDGDPIIVSEVNGSDLNVGSQIALASGSTLLVNEDGSFIYTPISGFAGKDTFTYAICENIPGGVCSNVVTVTIKVNEAPIASADSYAAKKSTKLSVNKPGVLANDKDMNLDTINAVLVQKPASGTLTFKSDGSFAYTPVKNFVGNVTFTYKACETITTAKLCSPETTVTITVK